jgi:hypothetical protein
MGTQAGVIGKSGAASTATASPGSAIYNKETGKVIGNVPSAASARANPGFTETTSEKPIGEQQEKSHVIPGLGGMTWGPFGTKVVDSPKVGAYIEKIRTRIPISEGSNSIPQTATSPQAVNPDEVQKQVLGASENSYKSAEDVRADFKAGKIDRAKAKEILKKQFELE